MESKLGFGRVSNTCAALMEFTIQQIMFGRWLAAMLSRDEPSSLPDEVQRWEDEGGAQYWLDEPYTHVVSFYGNPSIPTHR